MRDYPARVDDFADFADSAAVQTPGPVQPCWSAPWSVPTEEALP